MTPQHPELRMGGNVPLGYDVKDRKLVVRNKGEHMAEVNSPLRP